MSFSLQNLAMFLSMLVAWMIPDVPRSLREQLKKENMMLMEFLLNQDQGARAKSQSPRRSIPCFPVNLDIVVEAPPEEQEEQRVQEEEEGVEIHLDERRRTSDSDPEVGKPLDVGLEENGQGEREGEVEGEGGEVEGGEKEKDGEVNEEDGMGNNEQEGGEEKEEGGQREEEEKELNAEETENFTVDLDSFMSELGMLGERRKHNVPRFLSNCTFKFVILPCLTLVIYFSISCDVDEESSSSAGYTELPRSGSKQEYQKDQESPSHPSSKRGSSQCLKSSRTEITTPDNDNRLFSLIAPPPREPGSRAKARCSTLPSRHRGSEACYSLPRPSQSTSLTRLQQKATLTPLVPLGPSLSASSNPFSPPHTPVSPSPSKQSPSAQHPRAPSELFALKGPPPQQPRSRGKARCSTLPARQRAPGPEEHSTKPSHSTSFTKLGDRIPPSPSELERNTPV